jgi:hypothetical protein
VSGNHYVVTHVYEEDLLFGTGMVVFDPKKSTSYDFDWDGGQWVFSERQDFAECAEESDPYGHQLK